MVEIREIKKQEFKRASFHSHIKGLGLRNGKALFKADGMVGQIEAREAAGLIVEMIKQGKMSGKGVLIVGPPGTGKCVAPETPIILDNGEIKSAEEIFNEYKNEGIIIKDDGEETIIELPSKRLNVLSLDKDLKIKVAEVRYLYRKRFYGNLIEIKTSSGRKVLVSEEHPLLIANGDGFEFKKAKEIKVGDFVAVPRILNTCYDIQKLIEIYNKIYEMEKVFTNYHTARLLVSQGYCYLSMDNPLDYNRETIGKWILHEIPSHYTSNAEGFIYRENEKYSRAKSIKIPDISENYKELAEFLAFIIAESDIYLRRNTYLRFHNKNVKLIKRFKELSKKLFGLEPKISKNKKGVYIARLYSLSLLKFLEILGIKPNSKSREKRIPQIILIAPKEVKRVFLRTFFECKGNVDDRCIEIITSSRDIANSLLYLLLNFGIVGRMEEKKVKGKVYYRILIYGEFLRIFAKEIGFISDKKNKKLKELIEKSSNTKQSAWKYESGKINISRRKFQEIASKLENDELKIITNSDIFWDKVESIRKVEYNGYIYDFSVPETQTFIGGFGGIILHNTAIAIAMARELGEGVPFVELTASEIYSAEIKKTEVLMQAIRRAIGVRVVERRTVYEGVVRELKIRRVKNPYNPYYYLPREATITLETKDDALSLSVGQEIATQLINLGVRKGDVIWIDADTGRVHKVGRARGEKKYDIDISSVEIPSGRVKKEKEIINTFTLHDLDYSLLLQKASITSLFGFLSEREIGKEIRETVDEEVKKLVQQGKASIVPGLLFIDDAHMLDIEVYSFLTRAMESDLSPIFVLATNRGITKIRGTDIESPHGMPLDLLDRLLIIKTKPYTEEEIREIIKIRAEEEDVELSEDALEELVKIGVETSLRHATQLIWPAKIIANREGRNIIKREDVVKVKGLFIDVKESVEYVKQFEEKFLR